MNALISRCTNYFALAVSFGFLLNASVYADVTYSWSGHMELFAAGEPDPWLIGPTGADFVLQTTVSSSASDINSTQVSFAQFVPEVIRLWINNEEVAFVDSANIDFTDTDNIIDSITAGGRFSKLGQVVDISSVVGLAASTFSFTLAAEVPPYFSSTISSGNAQSNQHPYVTIVQGGTLVTVVPEPCGILLTVMGFATFAAGRTRCWSGR